MPRNVRNFWLELEVDGKKSKIEIGPVAKDGGFRLVIKIREDGEISYRTAEIRGEVSSDGILSVVSRVADGNDVLLRVRR